MLLFYCNHLIDLYGHMIVSYFCNSFVRVFVTQVGRLVLRVLYTHAVWAFISHEDTCGGGGYSHSLFSLAKHLLLKWPTFPQEPHIRKALLSTYTNQSCFDIIALSTSKVVSASLSKLQ